MDDNANITASEFSERMRSIRDGLPRPVCVVGVLDGGWGEPIAEVTDDGSLRVLRDIPIKEMQVFLGWCLRRWPRYMPIPGTADSDEPPMRVRMF